MTEPAIPDPQGRPPVKPWQRLVPELGPLVVFFSAFKLNDALGLSDLLGLSSPLMVATALFMAATVIAVVLAWRWQGRVPPMLWVSSAIVAVMGALTLWFDNATFVKMKPTLISLVFAAVLGLGVFTGRPLLKPVMAHALPPLADTGWLKVSRNMALFFAATAGLNELVWRTQSTDLWVTYKTFGVMPLTFLFVMTQIPLLLRYRLDGAGDSASE
ncbi:septation protein A [Yunchengibacter salinarum]|uniref:septation protein A n=1 Tax=Yunchengibacter salinarum TaxID=3133399 RepID=UPI0035B62753